MSLEHMEDQKTGLFSPIRISEMEVKNRVILPALWGEKGSRTFSIVLKAVIGLGNELWGS